MVAERLPAMWGSETLTTVVSSTSINVLSITAMAMIHGFIAGGFCRSSLTIDSLLPDWIDARMHSKCQSPNCARGYTCHINNRAIAVFRTFFTVSHRAREIIDFRDNRRRLGKTTSSDSVRMQ